MQTDSNDLRDEMALLKLKTLEQRIQYLQQRTSETESRVQTAEVLFPSDPTAQTNYLMRFDMPGSNGIPSHSLIEADLERIERELGDDYTSEKSKAEKEFAEAIVALLSARSRGAEITETSAAFLHTLHTSTKIMRMALRAAITLQRKLVTQLEGSGHQNQSVAVSTDRDAKNTKGKPHWDKEHGLLLLGSEIEREVAPKAKNVIKILDAFENKGWPDIIDDPLIEEIDRNGSLGPQRLPYPERLHSTLKSLNSGPKRLRFHTDGTGQRIKWERLDRPDNSPTTDNSLTST